MPTPLKHTRNMRKHLTNAERESRERAEGALERGKAQLRPPTWLGDTARKIFQTTKRRLHHYDLLEAVDIDMLAMYADALARYQDAIQGLGLDADVKSVQAAQAWSRIALTYADKLGFSQTARARLARRKAMEEPKDEMESLLDDVNLYLNGDGAARGGPDER